MLQKVFVTALCVKFISIQITGLVYGFCLSKDTIFVVEVVHCEKHKTDLTLFL